MKKLVAVICFIFIVSLGACSNKNIDKRDTSSNSVQEVNNKLDININTKDYKEYGKDILKAIKHSIDNDYEVDKDKQVFFDNYIKDYHGDNFYSKEFQNKYSEEDRIFMEDVWFSIISYRHYIQEKSENDRTTIMKIFNKYI